MRIPLALPQQRRTVSGFYHAKGFILSEFTAIVVC